MLEIWFLKLAWFLEPDPARQWQIERRINMLERMRR